MTINIAELRRAAQGNPLDPVPMTRRMIGAIADELERSRSCVERVRSRDRVVMALQDIDREHRQ